MRVLSRVNDLWHRKDRTRTARYGTGKRWQAVWTDGAGREVKSSHATKDAARAWILERETTGAVRERVTVQEYTKAWQKRQVQHRASSADSIDRRIRLSILPALGSKGMHEVTRADVQDAVALWSETLAPKTVRFTYQYLSTIFRDAVLDGVIDRSPCVKIRLPALKAGRGSWMTEGQVRELAGLMPTEMLRDAVVVAFGTGARPGEWCGLDVERVDLKKGLVRIDRQAAHRGGGFGPVKTAQSERELVVGSATVEALRRRVEAATGTGLLFHRHGAPLTREYLSSVWRGLRSKHEFMGEKGSGWHMLRHAHASVLLSQGASVVAVSKRLGHKDATETLRTYAHVLPDDDAGLAVMGDLGTLDRHETATGAE